MEHVWSLWGFRCAVMDVVWCWLVIEMIRMMVLDNNSIGDEFQWRSNTGLMRLAGGKGCTEQWARWPSSETPSEPSYDCSFGKNVTVHRP